MSDAIIGRTFKVLVLSGQIDKDQVSKIKSKLEVKKIAIKNQNNGETSIRIKLIKNCRKNTMETIIKSIFPDDQIFVSVVTREDQLVSEGYSTEEEEKVLKPNSPAITQWVDKSILQIMEEGKKPIEIYEQLETQQHKIYAAKSWIFLESAQKIYKLKQQRQRQRQKNIKESNNQSHYSIDSSIHSQEKSKSDGNDDSDIDIGIDNDKQKSKQLSNKKDYLSSKIQTQSKDIKKVKDDKKKQLSKKKQNQSQSQQAMKDNKTTLSKKKSKNK